MKVLSTPFYSFFKYNDFAILHVAPSNQEFHSLYPAETRNFSYSGSFTLYESIFINEFSFILFTKVSPLFFLLHITQFDNTLIRYFNLFSHLITFLRNTHALL